MTKGDQLVRLTQLTNARFEAAQTKMAGILQREAGLRDALAQLEGSRHEQAIKGRSPYDPALAAGADLRWHRWIDQRRAILNIELAQVLALKDGHRAALRSAFGRDHAVATLRARVAAAQARKIARKTDYLA